MAIRWVKACEPDVVMMSLQAQINLAISYSLTCSHDTAKLSGLKTVEYADGNLLHSHQISPVNTVFNKVAVNSTHFIKC